MNDRKVFRVGVYVGINRVGRVFFHLEHRRVNGRMTFETDDLELSKLLQATPTKCSWSEFVNNLTRGISLSTAGRYTFRFSETPSKEGRGQDRRLIRCMNRT